MIRDYKFDASIKVRKRRNRRRRRLIVVAAVALIGTLAFARLVDLAEGHPDETQSGDQDLPPVQLSASVDNTDVVADGPSAQDPSVTTQILALPVKPESPAPSPATKFNPPATPDPAETLNIAPSPSPAAPARSRAVSAQAPEPQPDAGAKPDIAATPAAPKGTTPALEMAPSEEARWIEHEIRKGDTLAAIFNSFELSPALLHKIVNSNEKAASLSRIRPSQKLRFKLSDENELLELELQRDRLNSLHVQPDGDGFAALEMRKDVERRVTTAAGTIESSLFVDGQKAGLSDGQIMDLAEIFGWDIDFALELRAGDQFSLVYEELYVDGEPIGTGNILAAQFVNRGTPYRAVRYVSPDGAVAYFDAEGRNKKRAFIRSPVKYARISSRFTNRRWHPILKRWRSHKGVDYAAPTGTPIRATGAGRVTFRGRKTGYGRVVFIEHAGKYTTVYGHLSKFASKVETGTRVQQGQLIGYVGKSGLATGPHLHYEFRVAGVHRNPLRVQLPKSLPLPKQQLPDFRRKAEPLLAKLDAMSSGTLVASASDN